MARVTKSLTAKRKHKKVLGNAKGYYGARSRLYKTAKQSNIKALQYAFRDRKNKKEISGPCGYQGLMQRSMNQVSHIRILLTHCQKI